MSISGSKVDVICAGNANVDIIVDIYDTDTPANSIKVKAAHLNLGGNAANVACSLARLGADVQLMTAVGSDSVATMIKGIVADAGVATDAFQLLPDGNPSVLNMVLVHEDGRHDFVGAGQKRVAWMPDTSRFADAKIVNVANLLFPPYIQPEISVKTAKAAREAGCIVVADLITVLSRNIEDIAGALPYIDYFFPNEDEAKALTQKEDIDEMADTFLSYGLGTVVIKLGSKGCFIKSRTGLREIVPCFRCDNVVDTVGAGDNFLAGFIRALLEDKDPVACARFASGVAGVSIQYAGACGGVMSKAQVEEAMEGKGPNALCSL